MQINVIKHGDGKTYPKSGDKVTVHYVGRLQDGNQFESSRENGAPYVFRLGNQQAIEGWEQGIPKMSLGEKSILICPPQLAYGPKGSHGKIPANATLHFEIQLLKIN